MVATSLGVSHIRGGGPAALCGGVVFNLDARVSINYMQAGMIAQDGRCKTLDAAASGYIRSEGCGMMLLTRIDGPRQGTFLLGTAVNQDGRSSSLTAPNGPAQQAMMRAALHSATPSRSAPFTPS